MNADDLSHEKVKLIWKLLIQQKIWKIYSNNKDDFYINLSFDIKLDTLDLNSVLKKMKFNTFFKNFGAIVNQIPGDKFRRS